MKKIFLLIFFVLICVLIGLFFFSKKEEIVLVFFDKGVVYSYNETDSFLYPKYDKNLLPLFVLRKTKNSITVKTPTGLNAFVRLNGDVYELVQESKVPYTEPKKVAILYMATGKYISFWGNFYQSMEKYFLPRHEKTYFLFTDHDDLQVPNNVIKVHQDQLPWPGMTFMRFHFFDGIKDKLKEYDYIYFLNGTMMPLQEINEEIFPTEEQAVAVTIRAADFRRKNLSWARYSRNKKSRSYVSLNEGKYYVMGGFNGGTSRGFLKLIEILKSWTDEDIKNNVVPRWHDESMLNRYVINLFNQGKKPLVLFPVYSLYEDKSYHRGIEFQPFAKMIVLDKSLRGGSSFFRGLSNNTVFANPDEKSINVFQNTDKESYDSYHELKRDLK